MRSIIEKQDSELRQAHSQLQQVRDTLQGEESKGRMLQEKIDKLELAGKQAVAEMSEKAEQASS